MNEDLIAWNEFQPVQDHSLAINQENSDDQQPARDLVASMGRDEPENTDVLTDDENVEPSVFPPKPRCLTKKNITDANEELAFYDASLPENDRSARSPSFIRKPLVLQENTMNINRGNEN